MHMMRYSANARDVHLLRALSLRSMGEAARAHDDSIRVAMAAVMAQYEPKPTDLELQAVGEGFLHQVPDSELPRQFVLAYPRMSMHEQDFLREAAKVAEHCRRGVGDLTRWSAMTWGGHWRQRIGVEIARGSARCIERAATRGRVEGSSARSRSQEWDPSCCLFLQAVL